MTAVPFAQQQNRFRATAARPEFKVAVPEKYGSMPTRTNLLVRVENRQMQLLIENHQSVRPGDVYYFIRVPDCIGEGMQFHAFFDNCHLLVTCPQGHKSGSGLLVRGIIQEQQQLQEQQQQDQSAVRRHTRDTRRSRFRRRVSPYTPPLLRGVDVDNGNSIIDWLEISVHNGSVVLLLLAAILSSLSSWTVFSASSKVSER